MANCKCDQNDRRAFLKLGGMTLFLSAVDPSIVRGATRERLGALTSQPPSGKRLVYVFLRFGQDGLNTVVPYEAGEHATYMGYRPNLGLPRPLLAPQDLDGNFALNPVLQATMLQLWTEGRLAIMPTVGYPVSSRSHFDSQLFVDNGVPFSKQVPDGWLNRYAQGNPVAGVPLRAISFSSGLPYSLAGPSPAMSFTDLGDLAVSLDPVADQKFQDIQRQVYAQDRGDLAYAESLGSTGIGLVDAIEEIRTATLPAPTPAIPYPNTNFGNSMMQLAQLIKTDSFGIEIAQVDQGNWDHHANQQNPTDPLAGQYPTLVRQTFDALYAFVTDLGAMMDDTIVLTSSEFGRTARQNGSMGTDHGNAWNSFVIGGTGGSVNPGIHMGAGWPGLDNLRDDRDLRHTVDFRDVHLEALGHLGGDSSAVFPDWTYTPVGFL